MRPASLRSACGTIGCRAPTRPWTRSAKPGGQWLVVPGIRGTLLLCSCSRFDLLKQHAGIDVLAMYPAGAEPTKAAEGWTWDAFLAAAEQCHKAGYPFGLPLGATTDSIDWVGPLFEAFG